MLIKAQFLAHIFLALFTYFGLKLKGNDKYGYILFQYLICSDTGSLNFRYSIKKKIL